MRSFGAPMPRWYFPLVPFVLVLAACGDGPTEAEEDDPMGVLRADVTGSFEWKHDGGSHFEERAGEVGEPGGQMDSIPVLNVRSHDEDEDLWVTIEFDFWDADGPPPEGTYTMGFPPAGHFSSRVRWIDWDKEVGEVYWGSVVGSGTMEISRSSEERLEGTFTVQAPLRQECEAREGGVLCTTVDDFDEEVTVELTGSFSAVPMSAVPVDTAPLR